MRITGRITQWKDHEGFGFITPDDGKAPVFVHISSFPPGHRRPRLYDRVIFTASKDQKGRTRAEHAEITEAQQTGTIIRNRSTAFAVLVLFAVIMAGLVLTRKLSLIIPALYVGTSLAAFITYGIDKSAATHDRRRIRENTLHLLSLIGGWPGALAAQNIYHHKTRKTSFKIVFWITVMANSGILFWILSFKGVHTL